MTTDLSLNTLFDRRVVFPDIDVRDRWEQLVGIDVQKDRLTKMLGLLMNPSGIHKWADTYHPSSKKIINTLLLRPPLVILAGDVGCGKTELAETVGDQVARRENISITLYPMSLSTRGQGRVGEMTQLLSAAFAVAVEAAQKLKTESDNVRGGVLLLIDEGDAIAQSREEAQMHHEDRAGVNAFIRGVDQLARCKLPAAAILCTNRLSALDPAVKRRAADILIFERPTTEQRYAALAPLLTPIGFNVCEIEAMVDATGCQNGRKYGCTFSDLMQRLVPAIVLDVYPTGPVVAQRAIEIARNIVPTAPFKDSYS